jgi:hypothetical protein
LVVFFVPTTINKIFHEVNPHQFRGRFCPTFLICSHKNISFDIALLPNICKSPPALYMYLKKFWINVCEVTHSQKKEKEKPNRVPLYSSSFSQSLRIKFVSFINELLQCLEQIQKIYTFFGCHNATLQKHGMNFLCN